MTLSDSPSSSDAEREALATLVARFSADRDALTAGVHRAEAAVRAFGARLDALPSPAPSDSATSPGVVALAAAVDEVRAELRRVGAEIVERAAAHAQGAVGESAEGAAEAHRALASGLDETRRLAQLGVERATQAQAQGADLERRAREVETLRGAVAQQRDELLRRVGETEARFGVRLDSVVAGVEAETRTVRDTLWDRLAAAEQHLSEVGTAVADVRATVPRAAAAALEGLAAVREELEELSERLAACEERQASRGGLGGVVACVRDEIVAAVMTVVSLGAVFGRLALSMVR